MPVALSIVNTSWERLTADLSFIKQPLSVRKVRGTWTTHPSANFLRILSGTIKAALVPTKPGTRAGRLRAGVKGLMAGAIGSLLTSGAALSRGPCITWGSM